MDRIGGAVGSGHAEPDRTVRGSAVARHQPELATVLLAAAHEGPDQAEVYRRTAELTAALAAVVRPLAEDPDGPVTQWSSEQLTTWFERPWEKDGRQSGPVHHARAVVRVTFRDLDAFGRFLDDVGTRPGVAVEQTTWALTDEHARETAREVRRAAVLDAVERARDYAQAAGSTDVEVVAVADVGLLGDSFRPEAFAVHQGASTMGGGMQLAPEEIVVAATVEARFLAT